jgi:tripartite-type tricarboxylate transporter receptor subunit TctC
MTMGRIARIAAGLTTLLCLAVGPAQAQTWPNKPVKIIAPFAPGGAADTLGRLIGDQLTTTFKQQFFVENRGGAGGIIGALAGAQAEPDGYTLVVSSIASNVISPVFNANVGYDGIKDFTHIAYLGGPPSAMVVHPSLGVKTFREFVALARKSKDAITYISPGTGSHGFLVAEYVAQQEKYRLTHIPYKGAGPAVADLVAGHVKMGNTTFSSIVEQIRAKRVIPLAVTTEKRIAEMPDLPTFKEQGLDLVAATWFSLSGPKGLSKDITEVLNREVNKAMKAEIVQKRLALDSIESRFMSVEEFNKFVVEETARWAPIAKSLAAVVGQQ